MKFSRKLASLGAAFAVSTVSLVAVGASVAPSAQAAGCSAAVCMYQHKNRGGAVLKGAYNVCGAYSNLKNQNFNDKISSIDNWVGSTQSFWVHKNYQGAQLNVGGYVYISNLRTATSFNDQISSVIWIG